MQLRAEMNYWFSVGFGCGDIEHGRISSGGIGFLKCDKDTNHAGIPYAPRAISFYLRDYVSAIVVRDNCPSGTHKWIQHTIRRLQRSSVRVIKWLEETDRSRNST